ncbi:MAG: hypothetical protein IPK23_14055 [Rhizobiales bacterium]|nr:hypothetical protein [Hyphomicrobiales bacterium]
MGFDKTSDVVGKVVSLLTPLSSEERKRAVAAALMILGEGAQPVVLDGGEDDNVGGTASAMSARARSWAKQNKLSDDELQQVFDISGAEVAIIAAEIPGKNTAEKTVNSYVLSGVSSFLLSGDPSFTDKAGRDTCEALGCYDYTNHAKYMKAKGNKFSGTKDKGETHSSGPSRVLR